MKVLIADDDPVSRRLLQVSLTHAGYPVTVASNGAEALALLEQKDTPRLAVLDWMMPEMDGVQVCRALRKAAREPYIYVILLTARGHQTEIVQGLEAGADDYITKPFDPQELKARLRAGKRILELQEQLMSAREELRVQANHDSLTGLLNRMAVLAMLDKECARARREGSSIAVMMADLDHFKKVNDTYGHQAGDAVLRETARKMQESVRSYDSVGRYGGEEFIVIVPGCELPAALDQAERLRQRVSEQPVPVDDASIRATMSIGVAASSDSPQPEQLLHAADDALYLAKKNGRNRVTVASLDKLAVAPGL
jgi:two-component system, cell cycle response regulator